MLLALALIALFARTAFAHPVSLTWAQVLVEKDAVRIRLKVSTEDVFVFQKMNLEGNYFSETQLKKGMEAHKKYLLEHLVIFDSDGNILPGQVLSYEPPQVPAEGIHMEKLTSYFIYYELRYALSKPPKDLMFQQFMAGTTANFTGMMELVIQQAGRPPQKSFPLEQRAYYTAEFDWSSDPTPSAKAQEIVSAKTSPPLPLNPEAPSESKTSATPLPEFETAGRDYGKTFVVHLKHGIGHILPVWNPMTGERRNILEGWDHLLFILGLVLATRGIWDLVKVVSVFTLAHSCTLTLSVLQIVSLPSWVVEPMIALSILYVAIENIWKPERSRSWPRLAAAFGFGLFHGLGFAGGLMRGGMQGWALAVALVAFTVGVEFGHQVVALPLFGAMQGVRRNTQEATAWRVTRAGSCLIACAGFYYLVTAVRLALQ